MDGNLGLSLVWVVTAHTHYEKTDFVTHSTKNLLWRRLGKTFITNKWGNEGEMPSCFPETTSAVLTANPIFLLKFVQENFSSLHTAISLGRIKSLSSALESVGLYRIPWIPHEVHGHLTKPGCSYMTSGVLSVQSLRGVCSFLCPPGPGTSEIVMNKGAKKVREGFWIGPFSCCSLNQD